MRYLILEILLPMTFSGTVFVLALQFIRLLETKISRRLYKVAILAAALAFLLPYTLIRSIPKPVNNVETITPVTQINEPDETTFYLESPMLSPVYKFGEQIATSIVPQEHQGELHVEKSDHITIDSFQAIAIVYFSGIILFFVVAAIRYRKLQRALLLQSTPADTNMVEILNRAAKELDIRKTPRLLTNNWIATPLLLGAFRPVVLLPKVEMTEQQLRYALLHELTHIRQKDLLIKLLLFFINALQWFNPAAWILRRDFEDVCEKNCDETVASRMSLSERHGYASAMLFFAENRTLHVTGFSIPSKKLKKRLQNLIYTKRRSILNRSVTSIVIVLILTASILVGCSFSAGSKAGSDQKTGSDIVANENEEYSTTSIEQEEYSKHSINENISLSPIFHEKLNIVGKSQKELENDEYWSTFYADVGEPVYSLTDGTVVSEGFEESRGFYVVIQTVDGTLLTYENGAINFVKAGDVVKRGENISVVGENQSDDELPYVRVRILTQEGYFDPETYYFKTLMDLLNQYDGPINQFKPIGENGSVLFWPVQSFQFIPRGWGADHRALDIALIAGGEVFSAENGVVTEAVLGSEGYGNYILIDHGEVAGEKLQTLYAHLDSVLVKQGDVVEREQLIALWGASGDATGPHLHFEVQKDGENVPVEPYLGLL